MNEQGVITQLAIVTRTNNSQTHKKEKAFIRKKKTRVKSN